MDNVDYFNLISDEDICAIVGSSFFFDRFLPEYRKSVGLIYTYNGHFYYTVTDTIYIIYNLLNNGNNTTSISD